MLSTAAATDAEVDWCYCSNTNQLLLLLRLLMMTTAAAADDDC
jgi:hypothetical protein